MPSPLIKPMKPLTRWGDRAVNVPMSSGSDFFVVNKDAKTAQADPADPNAIFAGIAAFEPNVVLIPNPGHQFLDLFIAASMSGAPAAPHFTQVLKVKCYGLVVGDPKSPDRLYPNDIDSSFDAISHASLPGGIVIPLYNPKTGSHELTFPDTLETVKAAATRLLLGGRQYVSTDGVERIIVCVTQGITGTNLNKGVVLGRFNSPGT